VRYDLSPSGLRALDYEARHRIGDAAADGFGQSTTVTAFPNLLYGILAYCRHRVPMGVVEAINGNLTAIIRRGRGYRDHEYLILKAQKSTAQSRLAKAA
jgi:hypothetical protein